MKSYLDRITTNPLQLDGKLCIREIRISVQTVLEFLGAGNTGNEIIERYPLLTHEDISACLRHAAKISGKEVFYQPI